MQKDSTQMKIEHVINNSSYLIYCKANFIEGIRPADIDSKNKEGYIQLVEIAKLYFKNNMSDRFAGYLMEGHYLVQLWTAHLILEYGQPDGKLKQLCLDEIIKYSDNPLAPDVAIQEKKWLDNYLKTSN